MRRHLDAHKCKTAQEIAPRFNIAWTAAVTDALQWPDTDQPANYLKGFNVVFDVKDSGVFRPDEQPAEISKRDFEANNSRMVAKNLRRDTKASKVQ